MTRVLIIGSSHVAAYRAAADRFATLFPQVTLSFFAVPGPLFLSGRIRTNGHFTVRFRTEADRALVTRVNGGESADTTGADHLLVVGHRFAFPSIAALFEEHDILDGARSGKPRLLSGPFLDDAIATMTNASLDEAGQAFGTADIPMTFAMAPFPASSISARAATYDLARVLTAFWAHPDAGRVFDAWRAHLGLEIRARSHALLDQPPALCEGPFATPARFAREAAGFDGGLLERTDHRHMNEEFGLAMLHAFATDQLGLAPLGQAKKDDRQMHERIA